MIIRLISVMFRLTLVTLAYVISQSDNSAASIHHRIQIAVGYMTMFFLKPTISLIHPPPSPTVRVTNVSCFHDQTDVK